MENPMSESNNTPPPSDNDDLSGVYVYIEGPEKVNLPPRNPEQPPTPRAADYKPPTTDELAGVYFYFEGPEKTPPPPPPSNP
jgi:hypothetical protein